ncbi:glycosyltransferase family 2 protein [Maricaulis sp.]|uniref:glycosyltransferase family 2 protein n=1 Tax=Maricaulis sp. TaxID=1486257 RepID=UPI003A93BB90
MTVDNTPRPRPQAPQSPTADIAVLIVAYRSRDTLGQCIETLGAQTVRPRQVLVLENGSPEGERIDAATLPDWVEFIESGENLGFAGGNNRLAALARCEWLALLNPDAFPRRDWLEQLLAASQRYPDLSIFGSTQYAADHPGQLDGVGDVYHATGLAYRAGYMRPVALLPEEGEVFAACGAATFIRRALFASLGGFDEALFCYGEDVDLSYRARLTGQRVVQVKLAAVDHKGYASSGRRSEFATYYGVRNRLWVFLKDTPSWLLWALAPGHAMATLMLWAAAIKNGQGKLFAKAIMDGLRAWPQIRSARRIVQAGRTVPASRIAGMMSWKSSMLLTRAPDVRPLEPR